MNLDSLVGLAERCRCLHAVASGLKLIGVVDLVVDRVFRLRRRVLALAVPLVVVLAVVLADRARRSAAPLLATTFSPAT